MILAQIMTKSNSNRCMRMRWMFRNLKWNFEVVEEVVEELEEFQVKEMEEEGIMKDDDDTPPVSPDPQP